MLHIRTPKFRKKSVIFNWIASYFSILLIPILISAVIYAQSIKSLQGEVEHANETVLMQVQQNVDGRIKEMNQICNEIYSNNIITSIKDSNKYFNPDERLKLVQAAWELNRYMIGRGYIDSLYIYYRNKGILLKPSGQILVEDLDNKVKEYDRIDSSTWNQILDNSNYINFFPVILKNVGGDGTRALVYTHGITGGKLKEPEVVAIFLINNSNLMNNIQSTPLLKESQLVVLSKEAGVIATSNLDNGSMSQYENIIKYDHMPGDQGFIVGKNKENQNIITYVTSQAANWKYAMFTKSSVFYQKIDYIKQLVFISIILCILIGGIVTYLFLRKDYRSVNNLVRAVSKKAGVSLDQQFNEFGFIQNALENTMDENEKLNRRMSLQKKALKSNFILRLLKGNPQEGIPTDEILQEYGISFNTDCFGVLLFYVENTSEFIHEDTNYTEMKNYQLLDFIISNVVEEIAEKKHRGYMTQGDGVMACLINFNSDIEGDNLGDLYSIADEAQKFLENKFKIALSIAFSGIHNKHGITNAYHEAMEALEYRFVLGSQSIISYTDILNSSRYAKNYSYYFPTQVEQQMMNSIKAGDLQTAQEKIEEIFQRNFPGAEGSLQIARCLMFNFIGAIIKTVNESGIEDGSIYLETLNPSEHLAKCKTIGHMKSEVLEIIKRTCEFLGKETEDISDKFSSGIKSYIEENFHDANLTISVVGDKFNISPYYLSRLFKEQAGQGILEYINQKRIEMAKKLLTDSEQPIREIAEGVGFREDSNTFTRLFKKSEGVTPGKYRELYKNK